MDSGCGEDVLCGEEIGVLAALIKITVTHALSENSTCHVLSSVTLSISLGEVGNIFAKLSKEVN